MEKAKQNAETSVEWEKVTGSGDIDLFKTHKTRQTVLVGPYLLFFFYSTPKILYFNFETFRWGHSAPSGNSGLMDSSSKRNPICVVDNTKIIVFGGSFHFFGKSMYLDTLIIQNKYGSSLDMAWESQDFKEKVPFRVFHTVELFNGHLYLFGGRDQNGHLTNKLIAFNLKTNSPFAVQSQGPKPCERYDHSSLLYKDKMYIFGGSVAEGVFLNDLWAWDMKYSKWESITKDKDTLLSGMPGPRCLSLMQGSGDELFIFKGNKKQEVCEDLFSYNIGSNQWKKLKLSDNIPFTSEPHTFVVYDKAFIIGKHLELYQSKLSASALGKDNERFIKIAQKNVNETSDGILVQYKKIFEEKLFPDITFKVEGEEICAHRAILAGRSNYFKNVFTSQMMESHSKVVEISHIKAPVFKALLEFIYCDEAPITEEIAFDLFKLSDEYSLRNLRAKCELFLINHLNVSSVIDVVNHADLVEANNLRKAGLKFIGKNIEDINTIDDVTRIKKTVLVDLIKK